MITFKEYIEISKQNAIMENFGDDHDYSSLTPHHSYRTSSNHLVHVHVFNNPNGKHAVFFNKNLGTVSKLVHWNHDVQHPTKNELETLGREESLNENTDLSSDAAGKIAEHSFAIHMIGHKHAQAGTYKSPEHEAEVKHHIDSISKLGDGKNPKHVETRIAHGHSMANAALEHIKLKHGPNAKITNVGHTSKPGDIGRFTKGKHNDTQENPSDVAVSIKHSQLANHKDEEHYEGYSAKSSGKASTITAKNPAIHMDGILDHHTRKMNTDEVSRKGLSEVHKKLGIDGKTAAERGRIVDEHRKKEGVTSNSSIEQKANEHGREAKGKVAEEFHAHLHHLIHNVGDDGHKMIGNMLKKHLTADTSMPWSKIHAKGDSHEKVKSTITPGSESPMKKIFDNPNSKYAVTRHGERTTIHHVHPDGSLTTIAHYAPKTKSNAAKENVHGWNVVPASSH